MTTGAMNGYRSGTVGTHSVVALQPTFMTWGFTIKRARPFLRHSSVSVTRECYIKTLPPQSVAAMNKLKSAWCAEQAFPSPSPTGPNWLITQPLSDGADDRT